MSRSDPRDPASPKTCPSAPAEPGSVVLGVVADRGQLAYINPHVPVTPGLLDTLSRGGVPIENRMRFACTCMEQRCVQWRGEAGSGHCGLIEHAIEALAIGSGAESLPHCGIRHTCRWFAQRGRDACAVCPEIIRRPARN